MATGQCLKRYETIIIDQSHVRQILILQGFPMEDGASPARVSTYPLQNLEQICYTDRSCFIKQLLLSEMHHYPCKTCCVVRPHSPHHLSLLVSWNNGIVFRKGGPCISDLLLLSNPPVGPLNFHQPISTVSIPYRGVTKPLPAVTIQQ
jgi:hypothetical protein